MLSFRSFVDVLSENLANGYQASEDEFEELYGGHKHVRDKLVTHVFNRLGDKIATYNHKMGVISTNRQHDELKKI